MEWGHISEHQYFDTLCCESHLFLKYFVLQSSMNAIKEEPESDESQPSSPREDYEPVFIKTEHFEPDTLPIMKCETVVSFLNS